jgi:hypothetical protein
MEDNANIVGKAFKALEEMSKTEGFALTEDTYTARIPGKMLGSWYEILHALLFKFRSQTDL